MNVADLFSRNHSTINELVEADNVIECGIFCSRNSQICNTFHFSLISKKCLGGFACIGEFRETESGNGLDIYQLGLGKVSIIFEK